MTQYDLFVEFLNGEYGTNPIQAEVAEAIIEWSKRTEQGLNEEDLNGVSEFMTNEIFDLIEFEVSEEYLEKLTNFVKKQRNEI